VPFGSPPPVVSALACSSSFHQDGIVLAGTLEDGVYRSTDHGLTWSAANAGLLDMSVLSIAMSPAFADDGIALLGAQSGLFLSTTGGRSWCDLNFPDTGAAAVSVAISPAGPLFAGTEGAGLFRSQDGGAHWAPAADGLTDAEIVTIQFVNDGTEHPCLLAVTAEKAFRSTDQGDTWTASDTDLGAGMTIVSATVLDRSDLLVSLASGAIHRLRCEWVADETAFL
jgi:photosystem II stability/assembly factor-like uncharacterized protein